MSSGGTAGSGGAKDAEGAEAAEEEEDEEEPASQVGLQAGQSGSWACCPQGSHPGVLANLLVTCWAPCTRLLPS